MSSRSGIRDPLLVLFSLRLLLVAFSLNWVWEMAQGSAYVELVAMPPLQRLWRCTVASVGDGFFTLGLYGVGALAAGRICWILPKSWHAYVCLAILGAACAAANEWRALAFGLWTYNERMPIVPVLQVGLWPFLQLTFLVPLAVLLAASWAGKRTRQQDRRDSV